MKDKAQSPDKQKQPIKLDNLLPRKNVRGGRGDAKVLFGSRSRRDRT